MDTLTSMLKHCSGSIAARLTYDGDRFGRLSQQCGNDLYANRGYKGTTKCLGESLHGVTSLLDQRAARAAHGGGQIGGEGTKLTEERITL